MSEFCLGQKVRLKGYWSGEVGVIVAMPGAQGFGGCYGVALDRDPELIASVIPSALEAIADTDTDSDASACEGRLARFEGPSLLDQFAMAALTGLLSADDTGYCHDVARDAYKYAEAMMSEREGRTHP